MIDRRKKDLQRSGVVASLLDIHRTNNALFLFLTILSGGLLAFLWVASATHDRIRRNLIRISEGLPLEPMDFQALWFIVSIIPWILFLVSLSNVDWDQVSYIIAVFLKND